MNYSADHQNNGEKKPFVKPELKVLDVNETQTGAPDPNELNPYIGPIS